MTSQSTVAETVDAWTPEFALTALAAGASLEIPASAHASEAPALRQLPADTRVYLPHTPRTTVDETLAACRTIIAAGLRPVPHVAARAVPGEDWLGELLDRLQAAGTDELLLIAGDRKKPAGPYGDTLQLLDSGILLRHGFRRVGVAGHPEGHAAANDEAAMAALEAKAAYARQTGSEVWIATQFVFEAEPVLAWLQRLQAAGIDLPVWVGIPGAGKLRTLWRYALHCGVGSSTRMLTRRPDVALALGGGWRPDELVGELARQYATGMARPMAGIHLFPFGGVGPGIDWLTGLRNGQGLPETLGVEAPAEY
ncbi:methylenetetrahydrofolate reductase [Ectothiorhodospiraceae bacterium WFHF3C12]|nr:methylenetetrahydrofolate reductase [Ectothiorhodospiraceae bacterium WFHF3C12]